MHGLVTPLLRKVYLWFTGFVAVYLAFLAFQHSPWYKERLYQKLVSGDQAERASAGFDLAYLNGETQLIRALKSHSPEVRIVAINSLWNLWARAAGHRAFRDVQAASRATEKNSYSEALRILTSITIKYPKFSEGWNRRATLHWQMGRMVAAIADGRKAVSLNPNHFGAWQGMALCHARLGEYEEARQCIQAALRITPHDPSLWGFLRKCEEILHLLPPRERPRYELI